MFVWPCAIRWAPGKRKQQSRQAAPFTRQMALKLGERGGGGDRENAVKKERERYGVGEGSLETLIVKSDR